MSLYVSFTPSIIRAFPLVVCVFLELSPQHIHISCLSFVVVQWEKVGPGEKIVFLVIYASYVRFYIQFIVGNISLIKIKYFSVKMYLEILGTS